MRVYKVAVNIDFFFTVGQARNLTKGLNMEDRTRDWKSTKHQQFQGQIFWESVQQINTFTCSAKGPAVDRYPSSRCHNKIQVCSCAWTTLEWRFVFSGCFWNIRKRRKNDIKPNFKSRSGENIYFVKRRFTFWCMPSFYQKRFRNVKQWFIF